MKVNKQMSLDYDLVESLEKLELNVSKYCNEKLWDYVTEIEGAKQKITRTQEEIIKQMEALQNEQEEIIKQTELKQQMEKEGITEEKIKFLKNMSTNIIMAKDIKLAWKRKFEEEQNWADLINLKKKWG